MIGLIKKDILSQKKTLLLLLVFLIVYAVLFWGQLSFFYYFFALLNILVCLSVFTLDEQAKWDSFAMALPVSRGDIVAARYSLGAITAVISAAVTGILTGITASDWLNGLFQGSLLLSAILLIEAIALPLIFQFGVTKSRYFLVGVMLIPSLLVMLLSQTDMLSEEWIDNVISNATTILQSYGWLALPVCVVLFVLSGFLSRMVYSRKDL